MVRVYDRLYIGNETSCQQGTDELAVIHACKTPCHQRAVGYRGSLPSIHENYLFLRRPFDLYLNIIDPPKPLFKIETFVQFLLFASENYNRGSSLLIHCNQGVSRAPSLALLFLSKGLGAIPSDSFAAARTAFIPLYGGYRPGVGIQQFLDQNWASIQA